MTKRPSEAEDDAMTPDGPCAFRSRHRGSAPLPDVTNRRAWLRGLSVGSAFLVAAFFASRATSTWIASEFPDRPLPRDLLFETLPHVPKAGYVADLAVAAALGLLLVYAFRRSRREIPKMMTLVGVMYILRAVINVMTPLASPLDRGTYYGIGVELERAFAGLLAPIAEGLHGAAYLGVTVSDGLVHASQHGEFPSGHMAVAFMCVLLVDGTRAPRTRAVLAVVAAVEAVSLLVSHQHYSIDVLGGLLLSYFVYHEYTEGRLFDWLKPFVTV